MNMGIDLSDIVKISLLSALLFQDFLISIIQEMDFEFFFKNIDSFKTK